VTDVSSDRIAALVDKSLVRQDDAQRYGIHALLRQFAAEKLEASQEERPLRDAHCRYYAEFLYCRQEALQKQHDPQAVAEIDREMENVRQAWEWAVAQGRWEDVGKSLEGLRLIFLIRGPFHLGAALFERAASCLRTELARRGHPQCELQLLLARLLVAQAHFRNRLVSYDRAAEIAQTAVRLAHQVGDQGVTAAAYVEWGESLWRRGDYEASRKKLAQALEQARAADRPGIEAQSLRHIGNTYLMVGSFEPATAYYQQAASLCHQIGDRLGEAAALDNTACISTHLARHEEARRYYEQTLAIYREIGDQLNEATVLVNLGELARLSGDLGQAQVYYQQSLDGCRAVGARGGEAIALLDLGMFLGYLGAFEEAEVYCRQSLHIRRQSGDRRGEAIVLSALGLLAHYRGDDEVALANCHEALTISEELGDRLRQSRTLTRMGHAWLALAQQAPSAEQRDEQLAKAADAYRSALEMRRAMDQGSLVVEVTAGLARVSLEQGDLIQAQARVEEILDFLDAADADTGHCLKGATNPFLIYLTCYRVLKAIEAPRSETVLGTAHQLLQKQASTVADERLRRSFLERVAPNREIVALFTGGSS
jgi:tetratricopeptide (TPR) repeat protein